MNVTVHPQQEGDCNSPQDWAQLLQGKVIALCKSAQVPWGNIVAQNKIGPKHGT
jgi:hypothetical protein